MKLARISSSAFAFMVRISSRDIGVSDMFIPVEYAFFIF
jgi:hypothetical protein